MNNSKFHSIGKILLVVAVIFILPGLHGQLSIGPGGYITVKEGGSLWVGTDLHIKSVAGASGYLVDQTNSGDITITGDIDVERYMTPNVWHNVASPVSNENTGCFIGTDLIFYYWEAIVLNDWNFGWVWYPSGQLEVFKGYDVYFITNPVTVNYNATASEGINTGIYSTQVYITDGDPPEIPEHKGWNLIGNPYPSPVDWLASGGWDKTPINDAKYIWDGANSIYTIFVGGSSPIGFNGGTRFVPSNQGFWVQAITDGGSVSINNTTRVGDITGTPDFYKLDPVDYPLVSLIASGNNKSDEIIIRFLDSTTEGFDVNFDASKLFSPVPEVPQISIKMGGCSFALNSLPQIIDDLEVPLGFMCGRAGYYSIRLSERTSLDSFTELYIKDLTDQKIFCLTKDTLFSFYHNPDNNSNRFILYFNPSADILKNISIVTYYSVYSNLNSITILKNTVKNVSGEIVVYNLFGQIIDERFLGNANKTTFQVNVPSGHYIVQITTDQHIYTSKVLIINN